MAKKQHLKFLKKGVDDWNRWRIEHPEIMPDLSKAELENTYLRHADLRRTNLREANLTSADLKEANLSRGFLEDSNLLGINLSKANLSYTYLSGANLLSADLTDANLEGAYLGEVNFRNAIFTNANMTEARIGGTVFSANDLSKVIGLDTLKHFGPSTISIDTVYRSKGQISEVFLRRAGVPDNFIAYMKSLTGKAFDFYSCFISYASKDKVFAERLYTDLQSQGVRCWFAPEDIKIGDKFRQRIDESIHLHDKLLLILSQYSISSSWVEEEVESAIERERIDNRPVLFPIRIDDTIMTTKQAWAASLRRVRHIGDFTEWKSLDAYQKALERL